MVAIQFKFLTGKWHATPWGRQVNEGAVEWPPSPWRILRALLAVWHHKLPNVPDEAMKELIEALTSLPEFSLPAFSEGHTRHYMPAQNDKKTKIFDTFINMNPADSIIVRWPDVELTSKQTSLLGDLLSNLNYLGRAESWVDATLCDDVSEKTVNATPLGPRGINHSEELIRVFAPTLATEYPVWRESLADKLDQKTLKKVPESLFEALHADTNSIRKQGWNRPPGSQWVDYACRRNLVTSTTQKSHVRGSKLPTVARFAIAGNVRPRLTEALWIGERARQIIMGISKRLNGDNASLVFSGKTPNGSPLRDRAHTHAHFLCESSGVMSRGEITHLTVFAPQGLKDQDEIALSQFCKMWGHGGHDFQCVLLGIGIPEDFGGVDQKCGESPILAQSTTWSSRTPFVSTHHLRIRNHEKRDPEKLAEARQREIERIVRKELSRRAWLKQYANKVVVEQIPDTNLGGTKTTWLKFRRERQRGGGVKPSANGYGVRLTFPEPIRGPIALGYGSHFGLGQFVPDNNS